MPRFGTLLSLLLVGVATTATRPALAAVKEFPYEAVIEADETQVRCGPGKNFYVTMKLAHGQHVTVRRHDPGGWFMIDPPPGSFSLIRMDDVTQEGNIATVKRLEQGQASVRIGSSLDPTADSIFQRKLSSGERAEILGEVIIPRKDRQVHMFRIRPPRGEFRWIEGSDVAPLDPEIKQQLDRDPFSTPPRSQEVRRSPTRQQPTNANSESTPPVVSGPVAHSGPAAPRDKNAATPRVVITPGSFDPRHDQQAAPDLEPRAHRTGLPRLAAKPGRGRSRRTGRSAVLGLSALQASEGRIRRLLPIGIRNVAARCRTGRRRKFARAPELASRD
jgi:uncharacterized protein YgiM (DUF1202 family)